MKSAKICPHCRRQNPPTALECGGCAQDLANVASLDVAEEPPRRPALADAGTGANAGATGSGHVVQINICDCERPASDVAGNCQYCNLPTRPGGQPPESKPARVVWPWGEAEIPTDGLRIGRVPPALPALAARLETQYTEISRVHAQFSVRDGRVYVRDLGSTNGTYVGARQLGRDEEVPLRDGDTVRFGSKLTATFRSVRE